MKARSTFHYRDHAGAIALAAAGGTIPAADIAGLAGDPRVEAEANDLAPGADVAAPAEPSVTAPAPDADLVAERQVAAPAVTAEQPAATAPAKAAKPAARPRRRS